VRSLLLSSLVDTAVELSEKKLSSLKLHTRRLGSYELGSSVSVVSDYRLNDRGSIPGRVGMVFVLGIASIPAVVLTQPPVPGSKARPCVTLTIHPIQFRHPSRRTLNNTLE
jgi:hypothetical protein